MYGSICSQIDTKKIPVKVTGRVFQIKLTNKQLTYLKMIRKKEYVREEEQEGVHVGMP